MALQDLTPQLRTRLSRMERAVGWFVVLATLLLVVGFAYYLRSTAQRKGWFKTRVPYFTMLDRATGLRVGDPVMLMGFEVGQITDVQPQPPQDFQYNVYVEFEIREPNYGYLWTEGSKAKVTSTDLLGKRVLEVTKGTGGHATYVFHPLSEMTLSEAATVSNPWRWELAKDFYEHETNRVLKAGTPLGQDTLAILRRLGPETFSVLDTNITHKSPTGVWHDYEGSYVKFIPRRLATPTQKANLYWLVSEETPAVTEQVDKIIAQIQEALPNVLALTNQLATMLTHGSSLASNLNDVALAARPIATNLTQLSLQLREPGSLGEWMLGVAGQRQLRATIDNTYAAVTNANSAITNVDANISEMLDNLGRSLNHLADLTGNLNAQVQANTNILESVSRAVTDADDLVQGLKRHWLLRSAFKTKPASPAPRTNAPPVQRLKSPRD